MGVTRDAIARVDHVARQGLHVAAFLDRAIRSISSAVPSRSPWWYTLDPASLLITGYEYPSAELDAQLEHEMLEWEYFVDDFNKAADVVTNPTGVQTLSQATGGELSRSARYREWMRPMGIEHEVLVDLRARSGQTWGVLVLDRAPGQPDFDRRELELLRMLAPSFARGIQRGLLIGHALEPESAANPALVILDDDWSIWSATPGADVLLADLPGRWEVAGTTPPAVVSVAARALRTAHDEESPGEVAISRVLSRSGAWVVLHGAAMVASGQRRAAVILEPAGPARITSLLIEAYGLTAREEEIVRLVLRGSATAEIAASLVISPHTVRQHLKSIFDKIGVNSRREMVGKLFFEHYEPRMIDNRVRSAAGKPVRGGPSSPPSAPTGLA